MNIGILFLIPLGLVLIPPIFLIICFFNHDEFGTLAECLCFCRKTCYYDCCFCFVITSIFMVPILIAVGLAVGLIACAILAVPAILYQIYRIFRTILRRCKCCIT